MINARSSRTHRARSLTTGSIMAAVATGIARNRGLGHRKWQTSLPLCTTLAASFISNRCESKFATRIVISALVLVGMRKRSFCSDSSATLRDVGKGVYYYRFLILPNGGKWSRRPIRRYDERARFPRPTTPALIAHGFTPVLLNEKHSYRMFYACFVVGGYSVLNIQECAGKIACRRPNGKRAHQPGILRMRIRKD